MVEHVTVAVAEVEDHFTVVGVEEADSERSELLDSNYQKRDLVV